jgi:putative ABC transport system permease protein
MIQVSNSKIITKLSQRSLRANRRRNIVAVIAIALTAILFTTLFTISGGILSTTEKNTQIMVGTSAHAGGKNLTQTEYEKVANAPSVKDSSYNILVGLAENDALRKQQTEIRYSEDKAAKWGFSYPATGTMPADEMDIAMSTLTLDALGIPHKIGEKVPLEFTVNGQQYEEVFTLCGFWKGNPAMAANQVWLSRVYVDKVAPAPEVSYTKTDGSSFAGYININVWFSNSFNLEKKVDNLLTECGFSHEEIDMGINWAYTTADVDPAMILIALFVLVLILISGYLIIYNVFAISVDRDIRFYGLLKTIGTTGKQLRRMVRRQALLLSCIGIPIGLAAGFLLGSVLTPVLFSVSTLDADTISLSANPLIFVFAALFSLITVYISCAKPGRMAARVSPIEAILYTGTAAYKSRREERRSRPISPVRMALANLKRYPKKIVAVTLSLALSMILLGGIYSAVNSFDMDQYLAGSISADFSVAHLSVTNPTAADADYEGVPADFLSALSARPGVTDIGNVYFKENHHVLSDAAYARAVKLFDALEAAGEIEPDPYGPDAPIQQLRTTHEADMHVYGIDAFAARKILDMEGKPIDYEKLASGAYVYTTLFIEGDFDEDSAYYKAGDKLVIDPGQAGTAKEYTVLGNVEYPYPLSCQHGHLTDISFILAEPQFTALYGDTNPMMTIYDVADAGMTEAEEWTAAYCAETDPDLAYASRTTFAKQFENLRSTYMILGGAVSAILALIGILNFLNAVATSILSRKRELAMLQSIGMTFRQLRQMLITEGVCYIGAAILFTLTAGTVLMWYIGRALAGMTWFFNWNFSLAPVFLCIPVMLLISVIVTLVCCNGMRKESVVERLREE